MPRSRNSAVFIWRDKRRRNTGGRLVAVPIQDNTRIKVDNRTYWLVRRLANRHRCSMRDAVDIATRRLR